MVGHDWGARAAYVVEALFPARVARIVALSAGYATNRADASLSWPLTHAYWYEWLVATERIQISRLSGRLGGQRPAAPPGLAKRHPGCIATMTTGACSAATGLSGLSPEVGVADVRLQVWRLRAVHPC
ncbi:hypothetical protein MSIM_09870 [Mycobacterium simiae]|nr:hypothetical protein MSIM_09870 [Mycobacterium simiae]